MDMRTIDERLDHGAVEAARAQAFASLLAMVQDLAKDGNVLRYRAMLANIVAMVVAQLHRIYAVDAAQLQHRLLDAYEFAADRRYRAGWLTRLITVGATARRDADRAAAGALADMSSARDALDELRSRQLRDLIASLLPLFEEIAGSRKEGVLAALRVIRLLSPRDYQGMVDAAGASVPDV